MVSQLDKLKGRLLSKDKTKRTPITDLADFIRFFGGLGDVLGREFKIKDDSGKVVYTITQEPIKIHQMSFLMKAMATLKQEDAEIEAAKWGAKKGKKLGR